MQSFAESGRSVGTSATVTRITYDDFSYPLPYRSARIIVGGRTLYVNQGWLAELSAFFAKSFFGEEGTIIKEEITLDDSVSYEHFLELLRVICYCPTRKPLTTGNVVTILRLARMFEMKPVIMRCEEMIAHTVSTLDPETLFRVACAMAEFDKEAPAMRMLINRLATLSDDLKNFSFSGVPGDIVAELFEEKIKRHAIKKKKRCFFCL